jgi:putative hydrolase of HD superfamily
LAINGDARLEQQIGFIFEVEKLKQVLRQTLLVDDKRQENDAEHSWHLALMALILEEHAADPVDILRVVKMVLIHDIVEIDAGDTFAYDEAGQVGKEYREREAANRIFGLLAAEQGEELSRLWEEFEARKTADARYANALDRFQPLLLNYHAGGDTWRRHGVRKDQVVERNRHIGEGCPALWNYATRLIDRAVAEGKLLD